MNCYLIKRGKKYSVRVYEHDINGQIKRDEKGNPIHRTIALGTSDKTEAEKKLVEYQHKYNTGAYVSPDKMTFKQLADKWMANVCERDCEISTIEGYKTQLNKHIIPELGNIPVQKVSALHIDDYIALKRSKKGRADGKGKLSNKTINKHLVNINCIMDYAMRKLRIINSNPCDQVDKLKEEKFEGKAVGEDEIRKLFDLVEGHRLEVVVHLGAALGLRLSEICGLHWEDIDFKRGRIHIRNARLRIAKQDVKKGTKTEQSNRVLVVPLPLLEVLQRERERQKFLKKKHGTNYIESPYVVRNEDGYLVSPKTWSKIFGNFIEKHKFEDIRLHDLRHSYATIMIKRKVPIKTIQKMTGHSSTQILLDTYAHVLAEMEQEAVEEITNALYNEIYQSTASNA